MGKITVKHFLNTNLKPYLINKQNYYTIYLLVTAQRKTTKLKSIIFDEYYTENDFNNIFNSKNKQDILMIKNEISVINIMSDLIISELEEFDTTFLSAYYNFSNTFSAIKTDPAGFKLNNGEYLERVLTEKINTDYINVIVSVSTGMKEISIYDFYKYENQNKALKIIEKAGNKNAQEILKDINKSIFLSSLKYFSVYVEATKKTVYLKEKYGFYFDNYDGILESYFSKKYC